MTRKEQTGKRDLTFSQWIRENLPDSNTGFMVSDIDFYIYNYKLRRCMLLEVKTHKAELPFWQKNMYKLLAKWLSKGIDSGWSFYGFHFLRFENTCFVDGRCMLDTKLVTENEVIRFLSLKDPPPL